MDTRPAGLPTIYRHHDRWHTGLIRQWRRTPNGWIGDVWHGHDTIPIPAADLRSAQACVRCPIKRARPGYV